MEEEIIEFEVFRRISAATQARRIVGPAVTLQKGGKITMNLPAYLALNSPKHVRFLVSKTKRYLAIEPTISKDSDGYQVLRNEQVNNGIMISANSLINHLDIEMSSSKRFPAHIQEGKILIDLGGPAEVRIRINKPKQMESETLLLDSGEEG